MEHATVENYFDSGVFSESLVLRVTELFGAQLKRWKQFINVVVFALMLIVGLGFNHLLKRIEGYELCWANMSVRLSNSRTSFPSSVAVV
jgi:hypothetical protein